MSTVSNKREKKTFAEFFAGIGLMRLGLEAEGWRIEFANDIDPQKEEMYRAQFSNSAEHFLLDDINALSPAQIPTVALATASFPCNDLSLAGAREGLQGKNSSAFWGFIRLMDRIPTERRPEIILIENVPGFLTSHSGSDFEAAMFVLNDLGYEVDPLMVDASWFVPQSRLRLFVVATKAKTSEAWNANNLFAHTPLRPPALTQFILNHPKIRWRIRPLPSPPNRLSRLNSIIEDLPPDAEAWWNRDRAQYLLNQMSPRHRESAQRMISSDAISYGTVFRRVRNGKSMAELRIDGTAGCLRTPRGGSGRQILFKAGAGRYQVRLLSARECARLMGADEFAINVPLNQALFGFGDAVCVPAIRWIAHNYLNPLWKEAHGSKKANHQTTQTPTHKRAAQA